MNDETKLDLLHENENTITLSGQNTVLVNDMKAHWMLNKKKR